VDGTKSVAPQKKEKKMRKQDASKEMGDERRNFEVIGGERKEKEYRKEERLKFVTRTPLG